MNRWIEVKALHRGSFFVSGRTELTCRIGGSGLKDGVSILDIGSGRSPTLPPGLRPPGTSYVGLDISSEELGSAGADAYDKVIVGDIASRGLSIDEDFDLALSWQVLEHVEDMALTLTNIRNVLRPGGRLVAQLSGSFAAFALIARVMPHRLRASAMEKLLHMDPDEKFKTHYDQCTQRSLERLLGSWSSFEIVPRYRGAVYFSFLRPLERFYLLYEDWAYRSGKPNLATHYILVADH